LGEIAIEARDLLRVGDEGLVGSLGIFALRLERLVERLHAREFLRKRLAVLVGLLGVVAIGADDRREPALQAGGMRHGRLEVLFAVILNVFDLEHQWNPFPRLSQPADPGSCAHKIDIVHCTMKVKNLVRCTRLLGETPKKHGESGRFTQRLLNLLATLGTYADSRTCSAFRK